jgi:hypothetical protein
MIICWTQELNDKIASKFKEFEGEKKSFTNSFGYDIHLLVMTKQLPKLHSEGCHPIDQVIIVQAQSNSSITELFRYDPKFITVVDIMANSNANTLYGCEVGALIQNWRDISCTWPECSPHSCRIEFSTEFPCNDGNIWQQIAQKKTPAMKSSFNQDKYEPNPINNTICFLRQLLAEQPIPLNNSIFTNVKIAEKCPFVQQKEDRLDAVLHLKNGNILGPKVYHDGSTEIIFLTHTVHLWWMTAHFDEIAKELESHDLTLESIQPMTVDQIQKYISDMPREDSIILESLIHIHHCLCKPQGRQVMTINIYYNGYMLTSCYIISSNIKLWEYHLMY